MTEDQDRGTQGSGPALEFKAWLARFNGSRWPVFEDEDARQWLELAEGVLTYWIHYKNNRIAPAGTRLKKWSVALEKREFVHWDAYEEYSYEISEDGEVVTSHYIWSRAPQLAGHIQKFHREK